ncbi:MAG: hypothetical protein QOI81_1715 [Actinomycetota bacterium]|nr:hypothetical protein [Actinomycetota bacterium]
MSEFNVGEVPEDEHSRRIHLSNAFGHLLFETVRTPAMGKTLLLEESVRTPVEELLDKQIYAILRILDGDSYPIRNEDVEVEFVLSARLRRREDREVIADVELAPDGEGLSVGYQRWLAGDFGGSPGMQL